MLYLGAIVFSYTFTPEEVKDLPTRKFCGTLASVALRSETTEDYLFLDVEASFLNSPLSDVSTLLLPLVLSAYCLASYFRVYVTCFLTKTISQYENATTYLG